MSDAGTEMENLESSFQSIDFKLNEISKEKEKAIEQQLKPYIDQIQLQPIEDKLNQIRQEMIDKLKEIHDNSINEMNALIAKYKQPKYRANKYKRAKSIKQAIQEAEKIVQSQAKMASNKIYSNWPRLSSFHKLKYTNAFKGMTLVKYVDLMPHILRDSHNRNDKDEFAMPINKTSILELFAPEVSFERSDSNFEYADQCIFTAYDLNGGLISSERFEDNPSDIVSINNIIDTFSIVNDHLVTVRLYDMYDSKLTGKRFLSKFKSDRLDTNNLIECFKSAKGSVIEVLLIDVFDLTLNRISQATIKAYDSNEVYVHTCGHNGIMIQSIFEKDKRDTHYFSLYSLGLKLKRKRIKVDLNKDDSAGPIEFNPIKFDDEKCFFLKCHPKFDSSSSIEVYSFKDSAFLQELSTSLPMRSLNYKLMVIDSNQNLLYAAYDDQTNGTSLNCFNLLTKEFKKSLLPQLFYLTKLTLTKDERIIFSDSNKIDNNFFYMLDDNFLDLDSFFSL